ncbi:hypothetical protein [Desulfosporosinus fructosivorans]|uniref:hypothetical protein n=1 Tax=Desulfosporosinus fructosivorans TaxID=2018669 RepID=UPI0018EEA867|nr:hypothetical protein [Desulfosporosinus fructosivorans]
MKNLGYRKCLQLYELLEIGCQIYRSRVTPRNKKVRTQHVEGIHKKKAEAANQIGANNCPNVAGSYSRERVIMEI